MRRALLAFQFLTIAPVKVPGDITESDVAGSAVFFPLVGLFQGLVIAVSALALVKVLPADIAAGFALVSLILSNGGFDLDGLADTFDALAVKSCGDAARDRAKRLSVMKDSTTGAMGVIALTVAILLKFVLMHRLLADFPILIAVSVFLLMPAYSKWITVPVMYHAVAARQDGLGRIFIEHTGLGSVITATTIILAATLLVFSLNFGMSFLTEGLAVCVVTVVAIYLFGLLSVRFLLKRFGGLTGDHFGAITEISEILFMAAAYIWLRHSTMQA